MIDNSIIRVLVLGISGMLGNAVFRLFSVSNGFTTIGTARSQTSLRHLPLEIQPNVICGIDANDTDGLIKLFAYSRPDVVINCIGLIKQLKIANDPLVAIPINSIFPHRLARLCDAVGARLIHMGTDCVFSGLKGMYRESDLSDASDLYGCSKYLGEVDYPHAITLRTSIIGHERESSHSLVDWLLSQTGDIKGYSRAIFSGLPTIEIAKIIRDYVIPNTDLHGVYHLSATPISKLNLLTLIAQAYGKTINIKPDEYLIIDRSLDSIRFREATGFFPKSWPELIQAMHEFK